MEHIYPTEGMAKIERRKLISEGWSVSLIAFDPERNMYVFDVFG